MTDGEPRIGARIQRLRRQKNMSQAQLAQMLDISPSYLNLLEHNRRRITVPVLLKIAQFFGVEAGTLAESGDTRLVGDLMELFGDEMFVDFELTNMDVRDVAESNAKFGHAVVRLFDRFRALQKSQGSAAAISPDRDVGTDALSDFLQQHMNYFPLLENAADRVRHDLDLVSDSFEHGLKAYLYNVFGLRWRQAILPNVQSHQIDANAIVTAEQLPLESAIFLVARHVGRLAAASEIDRIIDESDVSEDAIPLTRDGLAAYFAAALMMPYAAFHDACIRTRYDVERIGRTFRTSFEQVCHRMTTLQRPGMSGVPLHLIRTDIAGNISKRFSLSGIHIPRHSGACPRWNVYSAFLHPDEISVQISQMPDGQRYFCLAKSITKGGYRHNAPRRHLSIGLGCHIGNASALVYSDGIDVMTSEQVVPIGGGCTVCPRLDCGQRAYPPHRSVLSSLNA